jgi:riboflavin kinase/FMN adenylyltransferase
VGGRLIDGVASLGVRPTFGSGPPSIEVFLFDYDGDLYGKHLEVAFIKRLRGEERFPDADALVHQIRRDVEQAREVLAMVR